MILKLSISLLLTQFVLGGVVGPGAPEGSTKPPKKNQTSDDQGHQVARGVVGPGAPETTLEPEESTTRRSRFPSVAPPVTGEQDLPTRPPPGGGVGVVGSGAPESTHEPEESTTRRAMVGTILVTRPRPTVRSLPSGAEGDLVFEEDTIAEGVVGPGAPEDGSTKPPKKNQTSDDQGHQVARGVVGPGAPETTAEPEESTTRRIRFPSVAPPVTGEQDLPTRPPPGGDPSIPQGVAYDSFRHVPIGKGVVGPGAPESTHEPEESTTRRAMVGTILITRPRVTVPSATEKGLHFVDNFDFLKRRQRLARGVVGTEDPNCSTHSVDPALLDNQDLGPGGAIQSEPGTTTKAPGVDQTTPVREDPSTSPSPVTSSNSASESPVSSTPPPCSDIMCSVQQVLQQLLTQLLSALQNIFGSFLSALGIDLTNFA